VEGLVGHLVRIGLALVGIGWEFGKDRLRIWKGLVGDLERIGLAFG